MRPARWSLILTFIVALWPTAPSHAQSPEVMEAYDQYRYHYERGNYAAAVPFA